MKLVLSIDGGGIRGILAARLLQAMQESSIFPKFDLISGTSTGGIIACGLASGVPAKTIVDLYEQHGTEVFDKWALGENALQPKFRPGALESRLQATFGATRLSQVTSELLIPSYCVQLPCPVDSDGDGVPESASSWFFKSWVAREKPDYDWPLWHVARCTSAAPTYFPTMEIKDHWMIDGGVFANNPADCALADAGDLWPDDTIKILSIGTGSKVKALNGQDTAGWGILGWAPNMPDVFMDGMADKTSYVTAKLMRRLFGDGSFLRCDIALADVDTAFDDASPENIAALQNLAASFVTAQIPRIEKFLNAP